MKLSVERRCRILPGVDGQVLAVIGHGDFQGLSKGKLPGFFVDFSPCLVIVEGFL